MTIGFRHQQERSRFVEPTFDVPQAGPHAAWPGERCGGAAPPGVSPVRGRKNRIETRGAFP